MNSVGELVQIIAQRALHVLPERLRSGLRRRFQPHGDVVGWRHRLDGSAPIEWPPSEAHVVLASVAASPGPRALLITDSIDAGGVDEFVAFLAKRLPERGITTAIAIAPTRLTEQRDAAYGAVAERLESEGVELLRHRDQADQLRAMRAWGADVVAIHGGPMWCVQMAADAGIPIVETLHGLHNINRDPEVGVLNRLDLLAAVSAVSETVAQQLLAAAPDSRPPTVIPNGVDPARIGRVARDEARAALGVESGPLVVSLARYSLQKNSFALVSAFDEIADRVPDARLVVAGRNDEPSYTGRIVRLRERMRHGDAVRLRGNIGRTDVLLAAADLFVLDSFFEGWALAPMEALGTGVPVVSSDVGGAREQLRDGVPRGVLVPHPLGDPLTTDWDAMARARYVRQSNRTPFVDAVVDVLQGRVEIGSRAEIAAYALDRFDDEHCLDGHARLLTAAASGSIVATADGGR